MKLFVVGRGPSFTTLSNYSFFVLWCYHMLLLKQMFYCFNLEKMKRVAKLKEWFLCNAFWKVMQEVTSHGKTKFLIHNFCLTVIYRYIFSAHVFFFHVFSDFSTGSLATVIRLFLLSVFHNMNKLIKKLSCTYSSNVFLIPCHIASQNQIFFFSNM